MAYKVFKGLALAACLGISASAAGAETVLKLGSVAKVAICDKNPPWMIIFEYSQRKVIKMIHAPKNKINHSMMFILTRYPFC